MNAQEFLRLSVGESIIWPEWPNYDLSESIVWPPIECIVSQSLITHRFIAVQSTRSIRAQEARRSGRASLNQHSPSELRGFINPGVPELWSTVECARGRPNWFQRPAAHGHRRGGWSGYRLPTLGLSLKATCSRDKVETLLFATKVP
jgi:hypothetical protein